MPRKEIEYMEFLINIEKRLLVTLSIINLKAKQSKVIVLLKAREEEESTFTMMLKN